MGRARESVRRWLPRRCGLPPLGASHRQRGVEALRRGERGERGVTGAPNRATTAVVRTFNTAGPVRADRHYQIAQIAPLSRIDLEEVLGLIRDERYFVLHAPRQTGKTSALLALRDLLNGGQAGDFRCLYANVENGQAMRENVAEGMRTVLAGGGGAARGQPLERATAAAVGCRRRDAPVGQL